MDKLMFYNSRVRDLISQKYRETSKERQTLLHREHKILNLLEDESRPYREYRDLEKELNAIKDEIAHLNTAIYVWDEAREICFQVADEITN